MTTILLIDNEVQNSIPLSLESLGYSVCIAPDGNSGMIMLKDNKPDLVLLGLRLPDFNGYDICRHIRNDKDISSVPIIVLNHSDDVEVIIECLEAGADDYMTKPASPIELSARVKARIRENRRRFS